MQCTDLCTQRWAGVEQVGSLFTHRKTVITWKLANNDGVTFIYLLQLLAK